ncbi:DUF998 domain-containing protein [Amycolatopsis saalfeldensis]|uniref:DUF998 domain-containing protein n=1 Tax=Amycolatopsis saalfeldensis TaxID=394193 RepID=A0A1H8YLP5_9PSEU|nr:DUF998 domain-containing protein [Amycolatopsis saalfeldensis]SEP53097.1 Protein of unknown function [Amycolatopsis saalfeldensis]
MDVPYAQNRRPPGSPAGTPGHRRVGNRLLAVSACGAFALATAMLVVLHVDRRAAPVNPVTAMLSDYALTPGWWLWDGSLLLTSAGSAAVLVALRRARVLAGGAATSVLVVWCVSLLGVAVFTKDPQGGAVSVTGKLHLYSTALTCLSLPVAGWLLGRRHREELHWQRFAAWSRRLALAAIPFYLPFIVPFALNVVLGSHVPTVATGLIERLMVALELVLLVVLAGWARHAGAAQVASGSTGARSPARSGLTAAAGAEAGG